jgi:hypothetical protein
MQRRPHPANSTGNVADEIERRAARGALVSRNLPEMIESRVDSRDSRDSRDGSARDYARGRNVAAVMNNF